MPFNSGDQIGSYAIEKQLSDSGGMSGVYLAHDMSRPAHKAALKIQLSDGRNSVAFQDILRYETSILSKLHHPGVVHIYPMRINRRISYTARAIEYEGQPWYYAMEYLGEDTLESNIEKIGTKYSLSWNLELFYQLVIIVHYMHEMGYAHCDLKPQNIFLRYPPKENNVPIPVLVDFGSATPIEKMRRLTASIRYSAPEILLSLERSDVRSQAQLFPPKVDIWALGAILFEILTGRPLFNQTRKNAITTTILSGKLQSVREIRPDMHPSIDKLLTQMLKQNPQERPTTAQLIQALDERMYVARLPRIAL